MAAHIGLKYTIMFKKFLLKNKLAVVFFAIYFVVGCFAYDDYGVGWDEEAQHNIGAIMYEYASTQDSAKLFGEQQYQYHGAAWELLNYVLEVKLDKREFKQYVLLKHFNNWLLFFIASVFFYLIVKRTTKHDLVSLFGLIMFVLSPRIFAESFYNSKDVVSLSLYTISIYSAIVFFENKTFLNLLFHSFICGFLIDVRITGIIIPVFTIVFFIVQGLLKTTQVTRWKYLFSFIILTIIWTIVFWPVLWSNPIQHFVNALQMMGKYQWNNNVLYFGKQIVSTNLPWHYVLVWIFITTPVLYFLLFILGIFYSIKMIIKTPKEYLSNNQNKLFVLVCFVVPVLSVIVLNSVLYDAWRHLYFVYTPLMLISTYGLTHFINSIKSTKVIRLVYVFVGLNVLVVFYNMLTNHPYQNIYFNSLASTIFDIRNSFDIDYWGLSYKQGLERLIELDKNDTLIYSASNYPGYQAKFVVTENKTVMFVDSIEKANYFLTNYRWHSEDYTYKKIDSIMVDGYEIMGIYKVK